ncbi:hypothetical protein [Streptosporangium sp. NPDC051022]
MTPAERLAVTLTALNALDSAMVQPSTAQDDDQDDSTDRSTR